VLLFLFKSFIDLILYIILDDIPWSSAAQEAEGVQTEGVRCYFIFVHCLFGRLCLHFLPPTSSTGKNSYFCIVK
jgi:hypothetical protein